MTVSGALVQNLLVNKISNFVWQQKWAKTICKALWYLFYFSHLMVNLNFSCKITQVFSSVIDKAQPFVSPWDFVCNKEWIKQAIGFGFFLVFSCAWSSPVKVSNYAGCCSLHILFVSILNWNTAWMYFLFIY